MTAGTRSVITLAAIAGLAATVAIGSAIGMTSPGTGETAQPPAPQQQGSLDSIGPMLIQGLRSTPGCLGVDAGQMMSGKNVIFAWFENKEAALRWHQSETHQRMMQMFAAAFAGGEGAPREAMAGVPDDVPLLVIASLTPADAGHFQEMSLPVSQIAIETYAPMSGGLALGGRFAPVSLNVPDMRQYTLPGEQAAAD